jgi:hypothetical protein
MEIGDGRAFGSPVANLNAASIAVGSVEDRIVRANRTRLFQDPSESTHRSTQLRERGTVELLGSRENVVGTGVIDENIKCGMELNAVKLRPSKVAVWVVEVRDGSVWTGEIVEERLGQCVGLIIRWKRSLLRNLEGRRVSLGESSEGQNFSFPALVVPEYEFDEEETSVSHKEAPPTLLEIPVLP